jgi:putative transcription factor
MIYMLCDLCGERQAKFRMMVEGSELSVCESCRGGNAEPLPAQPEPRVAKREVQEELIANPGRVVENLRKKKGFGRDELAHKLGVKESILARVEAGKLEPDESLRKKLEKELGVKLTEFPEFKPQAQKSGKKLTLGDVVELR